MPESLKGRRKKVSGIVRKYLPEIEKRLVEGETRDIILDWICVETGQEIPKTTFIKALYRARQWAKTAPSAQDYYQSVSFSQAVLPSIMTSSKQVRREKSSEQPKPEKHSNPFDDWLAHKADFERADPLEMIKKLQEEGKIPS